MKKGIALICLLLTVLMLSGCNLLGYDEALDGAQVVARVDDTEITKTEWLAYRNYLASYYQQYYQQYFGITVPMTDEDIASYGDAALEQMIESVVLEGKMKELGFEPLPDEEAADVLTYADSMYDFYKMMIRYQNYPDLETVEEEAERLAAAAAEASPDEATVSEAVATVTDAQLDAMLESDMSTIGYTREYFVQNQTATVQSELLRDHVTADVEVTDEQVQAEYESRVAAQKESYDANPAAYATAESNGSDVYYVPAGYRGVKNLLISIDSEKQTRMSELESTVSTANTTISDAQSQLDELNAQDTSSFDEEALASFNDQIAALNDALATAQQTLTDAQQELDQLTEEAFAEILPQAQDALARAQAGEDFGVLISELGSDSGMTVEPNMSRGYLVCDGLTIYEQAFQDAAMALAQVGDISAEPVKTSYGYHILQYVTDVEPGELEFTDEMKEEIRADLLTTAQDAAYEAAVTQWVSEANVTTYSKVMQ